MGKGRLKAALARHEARSAALKAQESKATKRQAMEKLQKDKRRRQSASAAPKWVPMDADTTVCLIGEGDFSFAAAILDAALPKSVVATGLDSAEEVAQKYGSEHLDHLRSLYDDDATILHGVDACHLTQNKPLARALNAAPSLVFMFNFPHLGNSVSDQDRNIRQHQELVLAFFTQVHKGWPTAKVCLSLFDGQPYDSWEVKRLARTVGYRLERSGRFAWDAYPGYQHQLTSKGGASTSKRQHDRPARSYLFSPNPAEAPTQTQDSDDEGSKREKPKRSTQIEFS